MLPSQWWLPTEAGAAKEWEMTLHVPGESISTVCDRDDADCEQQGRRAESSSNQPASGQYEIRMACLFLTGSKAWLRPHTFTLERAKGHQGSIATRPQVCVALVSPAAKADSGGCHWGSRGGAEGLVRWERVGVDVDAPRCRCRISKERPILADGMVVAFQVLASTCPAQARSVTGRRGPSGVVI